MVSDKNNQIFTDLYEYMKCIYPKLKAGTVYRENQVKLPFMYFYQLDSPTKLTTLSNTEDGINLAFQIEVYTDLGTNEARKMATEIRSWMIEQGFRCRNFMPIISTSNVSRFVARYERLDV